MFPAALFAPRQAQAAYVEASSAQLLPVPDAAAHLAVGDLDDDGAPDLVLADLEAPLLSVSATPAAVTLTNPVSITVAATDNVAVTSRTLQVTGPGIPDGLDLALEVSGQATYTPASQ